MNAPLTNCDLFADDLPTYRACVDRVNADTDARKTAPPKKRGKPKKATTSTADKFALSESPIKDDVTLTPDTQTIDLFQQPEETPSKPSIDLSSAIDPKNEANDKKLRNNKTSSPSSPSSLSRLPAVTDRSPTASPTKKSGKNKTDSTDNESESKLARRIANSLCDQLCYDDTGGDWYGQKSGLWQVISEKKALKIIMTALDKAMPCGYPINKLNNVKAFLTLYLLLEKWENRRNLLPMANGILNTDTLTLSDYDQQSRFNWQLPYSFNADAKLTVIEQWLWEASGKDHESIQIIRAFFKMALVGGDVQKFLELIGAGGTGKSTLIRLLVAFIGEKNHAATDLKNLETNNFEAAALYGKRLVIISDSSRYGGEVSTLKALTGGDPVRLEKKNKQQSGSFVFDGVIVIASNEAIQTADYTSGLIRRRMPVNFNRKVTDADKQKWAHIVGGIETAMHQELPALLNWVLAMPDDEVKQVIGGINGQMTQAQREHLVDTNKLAAWLDDNTVLEPETIAYVGCSVKKKADAEEINEARREKLYPNYEQWCEDNAVHPVALQRFTANIIDVCQQLKLDVIAKDKDRHGKPIKGLAIRGVFHNKHKTPVTNKSLCDEETPICDEGVTKQSLDSDDGDASDEVFLSVINNTKQLPENNTIANPDSDHNANRANNNGGSVEYF